VRVRERVAFDDSLEALPLNNDRAVTENNFNRNQSASDVDSPNTKSNSD
jgi:hypothetical protein